MRILLVEDDPTLGNALSRSLRQSGYVVDWAEHGQAADIALHDQVYEAVVLDLGLPKIDGFEVLRRLRARKLATPVIVLTARDALEDRIKGLDLGADDYLVKPFKLPELEARLRALIRRSNAVPSSVMHYGSLALDTKDRMVTINGEPLAISSRELNVLETLLIRAGRVVSKEGLLEALCGWDEGVGSNAIEVYVHRLRKKLEPHGINIRTMRGLGYMLDKLQNG